MVNANDEFRMKCLDKNIELLKKCSDEEMISKIKEVFKKFDGKKYSKRFDNALKEVNPNLFVYYNCNSFWIKFNFYGMNSVSEKGGNGCYYADNDQIIMGGCESSCYGDAVMDDNYALRGDILTKLLDRDVGYIRQDIAELTESKTKIEEFRRRAKEIADLAEKLQRDCPKTIGDIFGIKRYWAGK